MIVQGIQCTSGVPLNLDTLVSLIGYQIEHVVTGRILPSTLRHEIYTLEAALNKLGDVNEVYDNVSIVDYELIPIYDIEVDSGWSLNII
jgi:hypothetical protein